MTESWAERIEGRINDMGRGWVFTAKDFLDFAERATVDAILSKMAINGDIRRLNQTLYDFPNVDPDLGIISADSRSIAEALARETGDTIYPTGAMAANLIGLSTQVQAKPVYYTSGPARECKVGNYNIKLKSDPLPTSLNLSPGARLVLHALLWLGKQGIDDSVTQYLQKTLMLEDKRLIKEALAELPDWLSRKLKTIL